MKKCCGVYFFFFCLSIFLKYRGEAYSSHHICTHDGRYPATTCYTMVYHCIHCSSIVCNVYHYCIHCSSIVYQFLLVERAVNPPRWECWQLSPLGVLFNLSFNLSLKIHSSMKIHHVNRAYFYQQIVRC